MTKQNLWIITSIVLGLAATAKASEPPEASPRLKVCLDSDWRFLKGDPQEAAAPEFDDRTWRQVDLPHDFAVEGPVGKDNPSGTRGGFFPLGTGWYRKQFTLPDGFRGKRIVLRFDGVMYFADVHVNGRHLGRESNPYLSRDWDITECVNAEGLNTLAVRTDTPRQMERWYTGAGIYRHVWLMAVEPVRVCEFGTYVTTPEIGPDCATVRVRTALINETGTSRSCTLETILLDPEGRRVAQGSTAIDLCAAAVTAIEQKLRIEKPRLWSIATPNLYRAVSLLREEARPLDRYETTFGIREIAFDAQNGFSLNGKRVVMRGVCLHQDIGALGAGAPDRAIERRLEALKEMGVNAIRTSHNPYSIEFLDLCDRMGFVVIDEAFDKWNGFGADGAGWRESLDRFLARDRNHPSVVLWSVGNEVGQQLSPDGVAILKAMVQYVHVQEPTRPVTCALRPSFHDDGSISEMVHHMDVVSLNYQSRLFEKLHRQHPQMVLLGAETTPYYSMSMAWPPIRDKIARWLPENPWFKIDRYVCGQFLWTGCEYLGEAVVGWPDIGWWCAPIDTCGRRKAYSYYIESLYGDRPLVRIAVRDPKAPILGKYGWHFPPVFSHWNWEGYGETLEVYTFTNVDSVELIQDGESLGVKRPADFPNRLMLWTVSNRPGAIRAEARNERGEIVATHELGTASEARGIVLESDRCEIAADRQSLAHIDVRIVDQNGTLLPCAEQLVQFEIEGPGRIAAVDNGNLASHELFRGLERTTYRGHALAIVRSDGGEGTIRLRATSPGLESAEVSITARSSD